MESLNVTEKIKVDNSIVSYEYNSHQPFGSTSFGNNDEIRIGIPEIDNYTLPHESFLYVEGSVRKLDASGKATKDASATAKLVNNPVVFMFSDIRYLINGVQIDGVRNVGLTSCMNGYFSYTPHDIIKLANAGWNMGEDLLGQVVPTSPVTGAIMDKNGNFGWSVPLKTLIGFAEDFKTIVMNVRQELVLIRNNDDNDVLVNTVQEPLQLKIDKVVWRMPHLAVGLREQLALTKIAGRNIDLQIPFRSWEVHEYPSLPQTTKQSWAVKTAPQLETPRFIIIGFQTKKKGKQLANMATFDNVKLTNLTVYLNGERYPYDNLNVDFDSNRVAVLYDMYTRFQKSYYGKEGEPLLTPKQFIENYPLIGIDCTYQAEALHKSGVEIRIEFTTKNPIPDGTTAYCLVLHDKAFQYSPLTKIVKQMT
ncbi:uncharacterized protein [Onthophagus taurus]|uniref:uncharacterized protein n=1 Tax=Onthophagus taurus TaxID=166361 RepID=UPI0039BECE18